MVARWVVAGVAATGCAAIPDRPGNEPLIEVDMAGRISTTSGSPLQFTMQFAPGGARMPQSLSIDGVERIAEGSCPSEAGVGIGVYPAVNAAAPMRGGDAAFGSLIVDLGGPTIARIIVNWMLPYQCVLSDQQAHGTSTFTIFPNGRIVRHDVATPSTTMLTVDGNPCGCGALTNFFFTSYWVVSLAQNVNADGSTFTDGAMTGCALYPGHAIGFAWPDTSTRVVDEGSASRFIYSWVSDAPTLAPTEQRVTSAIMLSKQTGAANCSNVLADLDDFPIMVSGSAVFTDDSGIYDDKRQHDDPVVITTQRRLPRGFAIALDVGDFAEVTRTPEVEGAWFAIQPEGNRKIFWFRDGLGAGESIAIDPR